MSHGRHRAVKARRLRRVVAATVGAVGLVALSTAWNGAAAQAPVKYGWWSATNNGAPISPPAPPDVPSNGLYVENGFSGASAISALSFTVPSGATVTGLVLKTSGHPIITSPPLACPTTASFTPAEGGSWSKKPAYDCSKNKVAGTVASDNSTVTFPVAPLVKGGALDVVIVAGGQADRIPFAQPGSGTLVVTTQPSSAAAPATASGATSTGSSYGGSTATTGGGAVAASGPAAPAPPAGNSIATAPVGGTAGVPPAVAPSGQPGGAPANGTTNAASSTKSAKTPTRLAEVLGLGAVIAAMVFWSEGFGLLGARVVTFAGRRRRAAPYPEEPTVSVPVTQAANS